MNGLAEMRAALEQYAAGATDPAIAIKVLTDLDGRSPFVQQIHELWEATGAYRYEPRAQRPTVVDDLAARPWNDEQERLERAEFARRLRDSWRVFWQDCGSPRTTIVVTRQEAA